VVKSVQNVAGGDDEFTLGEDPNVPPEGWLHFWPSFALVFARLPFVVELINTLC